LQSTPQPPQLFASLPSVCVSQPFARQGQFHILKYLNAMAAATRRAGGLIYNGTRAHGFHGGDQARVETDRGVVTCGAIVVATNTPVNDLVAVHTKQAPYRTYVVGLRIPRGSVAPALWWDTLDPYHYVRVHSLPNDAAVTGDVLIVGGEDHKTGQAQDGELVGEAHPTEPVPPNVDVSPSRRGFG
jgi:glycine/D-amino acid oxidase-like deaminating enzyme